MDEQEFSFISALYKPSSLLPISKHIESLLYAVENFPVCIIIGETGSGKTTQIPQFLDKAGWCTNGQMIGVTQPRRVAAVTVASRISEELGCKIGEQVGYSIRFEDKTSAKTRIKFLTDGLLLREALVDPLLSRYSVIMVDEAHERSVSTDVLLGILKKIRRKRPELRIIVSSATLQAEKMAAFFSDAGDQSGQSRIISIEGRAFPVDVLYLEEPTEEYVSRAVEVAVDIHTKEADGDILVFLSGRDEIETAIQSMSEQAALLPTKTPALLPVPLYAGLTTDEQMYVFEPAPENTRKVVFSTNIAEASVTIDGIVYVIDAGYAKLRAYDPQTGIETLTATPISKASAAQRAGRAGRTRPGKCYRLYTQASFARFPGSTIPEIQRSNLAPIILQLKALGIDNIARFDFMTPPPSQLVTRGLELLYSLGAVDDYAKLTKPVGTRMAEMSVEPMMAKVLLSAPSFGCVGEMLSIAALTSLQGSVWFHHDGESKTMETSRRKFAVEEGDHLTLLNVYRAFVARGRKDSKWCRDNHLNYKSMLRVASIRSQLKRYLERFGLRTDEEVALAATPDNAKRVEIADRIRRCLTTGYFANAARMQPDGTFKTVSEGLTLHAHPTSLMFNRKADYVIFHEILETSSKIFVREITKIERSWLLEYAPEYYKVKP